LSTVIILIAPHVFVGIGENTAEDGECVDQRGTYPEILTGYPDLEISGVSLKRHDVDIDVL
jgi:hypothetical protein